MNDEQKLRSAQDFIRALKPNLERCLKSNDLGALKRQLSFVLEATGIEVQIQDGDYVQESYLEKGFQVISKAVSKGFKVA
jgi:hypothetical protein